MVVFEEAEEKGAEGGGIGGGARGGGGEPDVVRFVGGKGGGEGGEELEVCEDGGRDNVEEIVDDQESVAIGGEGAAVG